MKILNAIKDRKSSISFSGTAIEPEVIDSLFEAARWAPSSYNEQPWRFIITKNGSMAFEKIFQALTPGNQLWAKNAPVLVVAVTSMYLKRSGKRNKYAWYDLGQAVGNISAQATSVGLKMHQMGGFEPDMLIEAFDISQEYDPVSIIAIGYPGNINNLDENLKQKELRTRTRRPVREVVFEETWVEESTYNQ